MEQFQIWWFADAQEELRKSCAMGWGFYIWNAAFNAYDRRHTASQIVTGRCSPDCHAKLSDAPGICYSAFCALKHEPASTMDDDSERMAAIGQNGNTGEHYDE